MSSWDDRADAFERRPLRTALLWGLGAAAVVALLMLAAVPLGWGFAWLNEGARVTGPQNVREQYTEVIGDWQALQRAAQNACDARDSAGGTNAPMLVEDPALAYRATYRRVEADYDRRQANLFEARLVGPKGYPRAAPGLREMEGRVC